MKRTMVAGLAGVLLIFMGLSPIYSCKKKVIPPDDDSIDIVKDKTDVVCWLTTSDKSYLLEKPNAKLLFGTTPNQYPTIEVDTTTSYQTIDGFGFTLTGGSAWLINQMAVSSRDQLIRELFSNDSTSIGISYLRISIGASDLDAEVFSYDDLPAGQTDTLLTHFSLAKDATDLIPVLKQVLVNNPNINILGSPWSAPAWMKSNKSTRGGRLLPEFYDTYARYLVRYIRGMQFEGIQIDAITIQNEPLNPNNQPSMEMSSAEQAAFIKNNLGPALKKAGLTTKIILYDHNCDHPEYPINILNDAGARPFIDGSAFHLYGGDISALTQVHNAYPDKNVYFTEQWVGGPGNFPQDLRWHVKNLIIGATRNWSKNVLEWNLASDPEYNPHTDGGCTSCLGALTISSIVMRNVAYYIIAHASKFVPAGSVRIASNFTSDLQNVAFMTPSGKKVLIVLNDGASRQSFNIKFKGKTVTPGLDSGAVATYLW
ncbi:MAG: glycoside hydrolase family 30 beta sandwich domain-containing protein [Bacteroidales bacterium]